jgi:hypothetical protein
MKYLGLHNKPKAAMHLEHLPMGSLEEEERPGLVMWKQK